MRHATTFAATTVLVGMLLLLSNWPVEALAARERLPRGSLSGTVLGPTGKPVASARVFLQVSDGSRPHTTKTDAGGHFHFSSVRQGNYDLRAQAHGHWSDWEHNLLVRSGRETSVNLRLLLKQPPPEPPRTPTTKPTPAKQPQ